MALSAFFHGGDLEPRIAPMDANLPFRVPPPLEKLQFDDELRRILTIAAAAGRRSGDETLCSYTSLMIGFLWADDPTSQWMQRYAEQNGTDVGAILRRRQLDGSEHEEILKLAESGEPLEPPPGGDPFSRSALTMMRNAAAILQESGRDGGGRLAPRDLMAAYVYRNPSSHHRDLEAWGIDERTWGRAFAQHIAESFPSEAAGWQSVLAGYADKSGNVDASPSEPLGGTVLGGYLLEKSAIKVLRAAEQIAMHTNDGLLSSAGVVDVLLDAHADAPECADLREAVFADSTERPSPLSFSWPETVTTFADLPTSVPVSHGLKRALDRGRTLALSTTGRDLIGLRHLIAGLVVRADSAGHDVLQTRQPNFSQLRRTLYRRFSRRSSVDDGREWLLALIGESPPTIAGYDSDTIDGPDLLDVTRYAAAFATVLAARQVTPPLSIGIFGDWGSGKSFFMDLIAKQTADVCRSTEVDADGNRLFCEHVLPIEFNAWHYAETNLWASLVQTIFERLIGAMKKKDKHDPAAKLELVKESQRAAERRLEVARSERNRVQDIYDDAEEKYNAKLNEEAEIPSRSFLREIGNEVLAGVDVDRALTALAKYAGIENAESTPRTVSEIRELIKQSSATGARSMSTWAKLGSTGGRTKMLVAAGLSTVAAALIVPLLPIDAWLPALPGNLAELTAGAVTVGGSLVVAARGVLNSVDAGFAHVDNVLLRIEDKERARRDQALANVREQLERANKDVETARDELAKAKAAVWAAEKEVAESATPRRIARMIERRLEGRTYEEHLSIITTIRRDFDVLGKLLADQAADATDEKYNRIDRIVLYIDDLDRCPSDKVVSVLEAIHLMLAYPLFVVVVGVDIRWARKSLHERYPLHLDARADEGEPTDRDMSASALDYLEKIFQVPFWLPPMEEDASHRMIGALLPAPLAGDEQSDEGKRGAGGKGDADTPPPGGDTAPPAATVAPPAPPPPGAAALDIAPLEREYMLELAGAVGKSPRRLKRFVNSYRILKASCDALEREEFVVGDGKAGKYRTAMMLLAVATGAPQSAIEFLRAVADPTRLATIENLDALVDGLDGNGGPAGGDDPGERAYIRAGLAVFKKHRKDASAGAVVDANAEVDAEAQSAAKAAADATAVADLRHWARRVARFSFRSGRI